MRILFDENKYGKIEYEVTVETEKFQKRHDKTTLTLTRHTRRLSDGKDFIQKKVEIIDMNSPTLFGDDKFANVYYSEDSDKIEIMRKLKASFMDRFDEQAPSDNCPEMVIANKIDELTKLLKKYT